MTNPNGLPLDRTKEHAYERPMKSACKPMKLPQEDTTRVVIVSSPSFSEEQPGLETLVNQTSLSKNLQVFSARLTVIQSDEQSARNSATITVAAVKSPDVVCEVTTRDDALARQTRIVHEPSTSTQVTTESQTMTVTVSESDGHQETRTMYPVEYVSGSQASVEDVIFGEATPSSPNIQQIQHGPTYALFTDDNSYNAQLNYFQGQDCRTVTYHSDVASPVSTYVVQSNDVLHQTLSATESDSSSSHQLSHTTRASPATIHWLLQNYETAEGVSLPRCTLYDHYLKHCAENKLDPVNAASFGKLIRSVFLGLRTRRLGTRGNSKYHYYGIRIKPNSPWNRYSTESMNAVLRQQLTSSKKRKICAAASAPADVSVSAEPATGQQAEETKVKVPTENHEEVAAVSSIIAPESHRQCLGNGYVPEIIPPCPQKPEIEHLGLSFEIVEKFFKEYRRNCEEILETVKILNFNAVDDTWLRFWQPDENHECLSEEEDGSNALLLRSSSRLSRSQLYSLCTLESVQNYIQTMDFQFYQVVVDVLIGNVLKPVPSSLTQSIRNFAKRLENSLRVALQGVPEVIVKIKLDAVNSLAQTLRRYTSLNHLAQAARAVLQNSAQISQMLADLNRVDLRNVQEQASWVCSCDFAFVQQIEKAFKDSLQKQRTLEQWAQWLESVVDQALASYVGQGMAAFIKAARQFLLKWSFYSSMVMRDLTLRSAPSFGSFHLIRLLYDEYMFYIVEQKVSVTTGQPSVSLMSQSFRHQLFGPAVEELDIATQQYDDNLIEAIL